MPKELFDGSLIESPSVPDNNDRVTFGQPSVSGSKTMLWSYFETVVKAFTSVFDWLDFTPQGTPPAQVEGRRFYDDVTKTFSSFNDITGSSLQDGREMWKRLLNNTGGDIDNGEFVYISGESGGIETAALAQADMSNTSIATIACATNNYINGAEGEYTRTGIVRDIDTSLYTPGTIIWLSATIPGAWTNVRPGSPNWAIRVGTVGIQHVSAGTIDVSINVQNNTGDVIKIFNGSILEDHLIDVDSNGTTVTLTLEKNGGGDLSLFFDGGFTVFDSTPVASVVLTAGTDEVPVQNWVYIPKSTGLLTANTSGFPTNEQVVPIADVLVQSAASVETYGCRKCQAWTDHLSNSVGQGHLSHVNSWIRKQPATHESGILGTFSIVTNGGSIDDMFFANTVGVELQLHDHTFPVRDLTQYIIDAVSVGSKTFTISDDGDLSSVFPDSRKILINNSTGNDGRYTIASTVYSDPDFIITVIETIPDATADGTIGDNILVYNDFTTKNNRIENLNLVTLTSLGVTLRSNNTYYSIVVFGVVSESQSDCKLYALVPTGSYSSTVDAISDPLGFTNKTIPDEFIGSGFLISRGVYRYQTSGSGTVTLEFTEDLRKVSVGGGGGTGAQTTEFTDAIFKILNAADPTKEMQFIASQITTGTTRTLTIPDISGLLAVAGMVDNFSFAGQAHGGNNVKSFSASATFDATDGNNQEMLVETDTTLAISNELPGTYIITLEIDSVTTPVITIGASFGTPLDNNTSLIDADNDINIITLVVRPDTTKYYSISTITA